jgi:hypothetical protein
MKPRSMKQGEYAKQMGNIRNAHKTSGGKLEGQTYAHTEKGGGGGR